MGGTNPNEPVPAEGSTVGGGGGLVGTLAQVGGAIYSAYQNRQNVKDTIAGNKAQSEYAYSKDLEMWNRQNDYNSPANQMARLKAAGINPNFGFSSGGGATGNASSMPKYNAPTVDYSNRRPVVDIPQMMAQYQDFQMRKAQIDNVKAQTTNVDARTASEASRNFLLGAQGRRSEFDLDTQTMLRPFFAEVKDNEARKSHVQLAQELQRLSNMKMSEVSQRLQNEQRRLAMQGMSIDQQRKESDLWYANYRNKLSKLGISTSDSPVWRLMFNTFGDRLGEFKEFLEGL